ncbi:lysozyme [Bacteroidia bacterium]|nr:lysozyme [Bacteroidia bacterium]
MNYKFPVDFSRLFESNIRNLSQQSEKESVDQNLELIITTNPGEHKYDPKFGCKIWDLDFERVVSKAIWEELFTQYISEAIKKYEPRICEVEPSIHFFDTRREEAISGAVYIKKRVDISIRAKMVNTGEKCGFFYSLYLGPLTAN